MAQKMRVEVDDREIDHRHLLAGLQVLQVVDDVLAGGGCVAFGCHVFESRPVACLFRHWPRHSSASQYTLMHSTRPASKAGQLRGCTIFGASISISDRNRDLHHLPQHEADGAGAGRHAGQAAGHATRHQGARHHHRGRAVKHRPRNHLAAEDQPREAGRQHADRGLHPDHPPRIQWRLLGAQGLRFFAGQRAEGRRCRILVNGPSSTQGSLRPLRRARAVRHGSGCLGRGRQSLGIIGANPRHVPAMPVSQRGVDCPRAIDASPDALPRRATTAFGDTRRRHVRAALPARRPASAPDVAGHPSASARPVAAAVPPGAAQAQPAVVTTPQVRAELRRPRARGRARRASRLAGPADRAPAALAHLLEEPRRLRPADDAELDAADGRARPARSQWPTPKKLPLGPAGELRLRGHAAAAGGGHACRPASPATTLEVKLRAEWLVCKDVCIPESGEFVLAVPGAGATAAHAADCSTAARAAHAAAAAAGARPAPQVRDGTLRLRVDGLPAAWQGREVAFFPETPGVIQNAARPAARWDGGRLAAPTCRWTRSAATARR